MRSQPSNMRVQTESDKDRMRIHYSSAVKTIWALKSASLKSGKKKVTTPRRVTSPTKVGRQQSNISEVEQPFCRREGRIGGSNPTEVALKLQKQARAAKLKIEYKKSHRIVWKYSEGRYPPDKNVTFDRPATAGPTTGNNNGKAPKRPNTAMGIIQRIPSEELKKQMTKKKILEKSAVLKMVPKRPATAQPSKASITEARTTTVKKERRCKSAGVNKKSVTHSKRTMSEVTFQPSEIASARSRQSSTSTLNQFNNEHVTKSNRNSNMKYCQLWKIPIVEHELETKKAKTPILDPEEGVISTYLMGVQKETGFDLYCPKCDLFFPDLSDYQDHLFYQRMETPITQQCKELKTDNKQKVKMLKHMQNTAEVTQPKTRDEHMMSNAKKLALHQERRKSRYYTKRQQKASFNIEPEVRKLYTKKEAEDHFKKTKDSRDNELKKNSEILADIVEEERKADEALKRKQNRANRRMSMATHGNSNMEPIRISQPSIMGSRESQLKLLERFRGSAVGFEMRQSAINNRSSLNKTPSQIRNSRTRTNS